MPAPSPRLAPTVHAAARGDEHAWAALVQHFTPLLRGVARGYRLQRDDVDEVVQACWVALLLSIGSLREPDAVGAWLITTARREALRMHQRQLREIVAEAPPCDGAADGVESEVLQRERALALRDAVRRLPGRQRLVLESLIAAPDRSYVEVSEDLRMPVGSIGPTRERGLRRLGADRRLVEALGS